MPQIDRQIILNKVFQNEPAYRVKQITTALFQPNFSNWDDVTTISKTTREALKTELPWMLLEETKIVTDANKTVYKALLQTTDNHQFETVLMQNSKDDWTICLSSQIGCPLGCLFCATGKLGLTRNLTSDEIIDEYRYWRYFLRDKDLPGRISNLVFMGMGDPLLNYEAVRDAINTILSQTDIGTTKIVVSTIGIWPQLDEILVDEKWPNVRLAISLHSADKTTRKKLVPSMDDNFFEDLITWAKKYSDTLGNRQHHLTFEYIMLDGINDSPADAKALAKILHQIQNKKVNLIPYNETNLSGFKASAKEVIDEFQSILEKNQIEATCRQSLGEDISAACGQLAGEK